MIPEVGRAAAVPPRSAAARRLAAGMLLAATVLLMGAAGNAARAAGAAVAPAGTALPPGLSPAVAGSGERVDIRLAPTVFFAVTDVAAGPVPAAEPFPLSFRGAQVAPGRILRISVRLESPLPPGGYASFRGRDARGGRCAEGRLSAATYTEVFTAIDGATAGACDLVWTLECGDRVRRAGRYTLTLRWQIESVVSARAELAGALRPSLGPLATAAGPPPSPVVAPRGGAGDRGRTRPSGPPGPGGSGR